MSAKMRFSNFGGPARSFRGRTCRPQYPAQSYESRRFLEMAALGQGMPYGDAVYFTLESSVVRVRNGVVTHVDGLGE